MNDYLKARRKAVAASLPPLIACLVLWAVSGQFDRPELALAITTVLNAVVVSEVPNAEEG